MRAKLSLQTSWETDCARLYIRLGFLEIRMCKPSAIRQYSSTCAYIFCDKTVSPSLTTRGNA